MFVLLYCTWLWKSAIAAPIRNLTALNTEIAPGWVADPEGRGTWTLLYSCLFTLLLCVYTSIHPNVPPYRQSNFQFWTEKSKWVGVAIIAPEIVDYTAFRQWLLANTFLKRLQVLAHADKNEDFVRWYHSEPKGPFDMVYAHYVIMGFAANVEDLQSRHQRVTLGAKGVLFLARYGHFCKVKRSDIEDKSKADILAKALVSIQVLWMAGQALERKVAGYPITLLEIHTIVHVICALIMYSLWIHKPLNVRVPTLLELGNDRDILGFLVHHGISNKINFVWYKNCTRLQQNVQNAVVGEITPLYKPRNDLIVGTTCNSQLEDSSGPCQHLPVGRIKRMGSLQVDDKDQAVCEILSGQCLASRMGPEYPQKDNCQSGVPKEDEVYSVSLSSRDLKRLELVSSFHQRYRHRREQKGSDDLLVESFYCIDFTPAMKEQASSCTTFNKRKMLGSFIADFRDVKSYPRGVKVSLFGSVSPLIAALTVIPAAYGAIHLAAINVVFPTRTERLLWMISSYFLVASAGLLGLVSLFIYRIFRVRKVRDWSIKLSQQMRKRAAIPQLPQRHAFLYATICNTLVYTLTTLLSTVVGFYMFARIYIIVESFISLRHVPIGVYQNPKFDIMGKLPHI